ncbi:MAG: hypothetical protein HY855_18335 [Burkholderiales bacterium]|nr:hypothetical protein [Burkholderiales bacterium]
MIQVQIASTLHANGVSGVRWVLVDPSDALAEVRHTPASTSVCPPSPVAPATVRQTSLTLRVVTAVVLLTALAAAWWVASIVTASDAAPQAQLSAPR